MKLFNTLTGEHFLVLRMADHRTYRLITPGTREYKTMNTDQLNALRAMAEIKVEEEV